MRFVGRAVGIDLGTTNSEIAWDEKSGSFVVGHAARACGSSRFLALRASPMHCRFRQDIANEMWRFANDLLASRWREWCMIVRAPMKTYLEFKDGSSSKFWEISVDGSSHTVRFGRIGTEGQAKTKRFKNPELAKADAESLLRSKTKKGYAEHAPAKNGASEMATLVDALVAATVARAEADGETGTKVGVRQPATAQQIADLERAWGRTLPPSYRAFLEVCNGIDDGVRTHRLLGTADQKWAKTQIADIAEFWEDFDADTCFPVDVPEGGMGIRNFAAFAKDDDDELPVIDWDDGSKLTRYKTFAHYLKKLVALEHDVVELVKEEKKEAKAETTRVERGRDTLTSDAPIPCSGAARKAAFEAIFALDDVGDIARSVEKLVHAKPTAGELETYIEALSRDTAQKTAAAFARGELLFHPKLTVPSAVRESWVGEANDTISRAFATGDKKRSERWADVARHYVLQNTYLGHNLACAYVAVGRIDDAFEMCKAAVAMDYRGLTKMRTDSDLGPLLAEQRFQKLFGAPDSTDQKARTSIPRNAALEVNVAAGKSIAKYAAWLTKEGSPLGAVVEADLAAQKSPPAKRAAKARFAAYKKSVLAPAFPVIAARMTHFLDDEHYLSFRYGFLDQLDTFSLNTPKEREEALALLGDPHAIFVRHVTLRKAKLDNLELFSRLAHVQRIHNQWTDITQVDSLEPLAGLANLRALDVNNSKVSDLRPIVKLPLVQLYCDKTEVVDLSPLAGHPRLSEITLQETKVRDLSPLFTCPKLCHVDLWDVKIDKPQLEKLAAYLEKAKNSCVADDAIMSGYNRGVSHADI